MSRKNKALELGKGLRLPIDAVTEAMALVGKRGSGKTYTAGVLVEEILACQLPSVIVDPLDVWWGLRSSADGEKPGLAITVLGGRKGDLPLGETDAKAIADLVMAEGVSVVLSCKHFSKPAKRRFVGALCRRLFDRNEHPLHVVLDEADIFAPQTIRKGDEGAGVCFSAVDDVVRRGRASGLGCTLITQRPAVLHKDVLTQAEVLIAMRLGSPQDRNAIKAWIEHQGDDGLVKQVLGRLPELPTGVAIVWAPYMLGELREVPIRAKRTFDSSRTPKVGERPIVPRKVAKVDLEAFTEKLAATVEAAKASDPAQLRAEVKRLGRELEKERKRTTPKPAPATAPPSPKQIAAVSGGMIRRLESSAIKLNAAAEKMTAAAAEATRMAQDARDSARDVAKAIETAKRAPPLPPKVKFKRGPDGARVSKAAESGNLSPARQHILNGLAWLESIGIAQPPKVQLAIICGKSAKSSTWTNNLGGLRSAGLIDYPPEGGRVYLTETGRLEASAPDAPPTSEDLHARLQEVLPKRKWRILEALIAVYPNGLDRGALATRVESSAISSTFTNSLGSLRSLGLIEYVAGEVVGKSILFLEPAAA